MTMKRHSTGVGFTDPIKILGRRGMGNDMQATSWMFWECVLPEDTRLSLPYIISLLSSLFNISMAPWMKHFGCVFFLLDATLPVISFPVILPKMVIAWKWGTTTTSSLRRPCWFWFVLRRFNSEMEQESWNVLNLKGGVTLFSLSRTQLCG